MSKKSFFANFTFFTVLAFIAGFMIKDYIKPLKNKQEEEIPWRPSQGQIVADKYQSAYEELEPEPEPEPEEKEQTIYSMREWAPADYGLEFKVNEAYKMRITHGQVCGEPEWDPDHYYDLLLINYDVRGTSNNQKNVVADALMINSPAQVVPYTRDSKLLKLLGYKEDGYVTKNTSCNFIIPFIISTNISGIPSQAQKVPEGILRVSFNYRGSVEIGSFK